ncbi:polysaccharide deacetylase family protein [uncultured Paludibaculum sp.]|uniref:polysaccharide deacetylase family protein n=1 Tax=uncultured Paludibaculum sp. TaxID=1765020 RepID=UPI002AAAC0EB|nr:polysaccharide deacetylase family protein [uncultured Paludibaculum sp.]
MILEVIGAAGLAAAGITAYGVRGRSAQVFGPSVWKGPASRRAIALTFDDGPSESTPDLLSLLSDYGVRATFFQCGHHVRRLPRIAVRCAADGHEIGNHTDTHPALYLRSAQFIYDQLERAQRAVIETCGVTPSLVRPTFGARWFGMRPAQKRLNLLGVMWTTIARDWCLSGDEIVQRMGTAAHPGAILCFHDGRELTHRPNIDSTLQALRVLLPKWAAEGYEFVTVSEMLARPSVKP